jgi:hypothetical protein
VPRSSGSLVRGHTWLQPMVATMLRMDILVDIDRYVYDPCRYEPATLGRVLWSQDTVYVLICGSNYR